MGRQLVTPDNWTPDQPHWNPLRERFCNLIAAGSSATRAYRDANPKITSQESAKTSAYRLHRESSTRARIAYLRDQAAVTVDDLPALTAATATDAMGETVRILDEAMEIAGRLSAGLTELARLRAAVSAAASRTFRLRNDTPLEVQAVLHTRTVPSISCLFPLPGCSCGAAWTED